MKLKAEFACGFCGNVSDWLTTEVAGNYTRLRCSKCRQVVLIDHRQSTLALAKARADRRVTAA